MVNLKCTCGNPTKEICTLYVHIYICICIYTLIYHICVARTQFLIPLRSGRKFREMSYPQSCYCWVPPFQESIVIIKRFVGIKTDKSWKKTVQDGAPQFCWFTPHLNTTSPIQEVEMDALSLGKLKHLADLPNVNFVVFLSWLVPCLKYSTPMNSSGLLSLVHQNDHILETLHVSDTTPKYHIVGYTLW